MAIGDQLYSALSGLGQTYLSLSDRRARQQQQLDAEARARGYQLEDEERRRTNQDEDYFKQLRRQAARMPGVETATIGEIQEWLRNQGIADKEAEALRLAEIAPSVDLVKRAAAVKEWLQPGVDPRTATAEQVEAAEKNQYIAQNLPEAELRFVAYQQALEREAAAIDKAAKEKLAPPLDLPGRKAFSELAGTATSEYRKVKSAASAEEQEKAAKNFLLRHGNLSTAERYTLDTMPFKDAMARTDSIAAQAETAPESFARDRMEPSVYTALKNQDNRVLTRYDRDPLTKSDKIELAQVQEAMAARAKAYQDLMALKMPVDLNAGTLDEAFGFARRVQAKEYLEPEKLNAARMEAMNSFWKGLDKNTGLAPKSTNKEVPPELRLDGAARPNAPTSYSDFIKNNPDSPAATGSLSELGATPAPTKAGVDPIDQIKPGDPLDVITKAKEESAVYNKRKQLAAEKAAREKELEDEIADETKYLSAAFDDVKNPTRVQTRAATGGSGGWSWDYSSRAVPTVEAASADAAANYQKQLAKVEALKRRLALMRSGPDPDYRDLGVSGRADARAGQTATSMQREAANLARLKAGADTLFGPSDRWTSAADAMFGPPSSLFPQREWY